MTELRGHNIINKKYAETMFFLFARKQNRPIQMLEIKTNSYQIYSSQKKLLLKLKKIIKVEFFWSITRYFIYKLNSLTYNIIAFLIM